MKRLLKKPVGVYATFPDREKALDVARQLVEEGLVACANVGSGMTSIHKWDGALEEGGEVAVLFKTTADKTAVLTKRLVERHPYECPCVVSVAFEDGHRPFLDWIRGT